MSNVSFKIMLVDQKLAHLTTTVDLDNDALLELGEMSEDLVFMLTLQHLYVVAKMNWPNDMIDSLLCNVWKEYEKTPTEQETNSDGGKLLLRSDEG